MAEDLYRPLLIRIDEKIQRSFSMDPSGCSIFKVPNQLRQTNEKAYEPYILSIGPYHYGKDHLKAMEEHKIHFLRKLLQRRRESSVARYVLALKALEEKARKSYIEPLDVQVDEEAFIEMMLLDGCFIIELIRNFQQIPEIEGSYEGGICRNLNMLSLTRDLLLVENQLPFFVLQELFKMTRMRCEDEEENESVFIHMVIDFFSETMPGPGLVQSRSIPHQNIKNLVGLVHDSWLPSPELINQYMTSSSTYNDWNFIRTATELNNAGIIFKNIEKHKDKKTSMFDIRFEKGVLFMPTIRIEDNTDSILRNLVSYEQWHSDVNPRYVTDYVVFMDCLINSKKDVELLCRAGVIDNWLGDDKAVAGVFNKLGECVELFEDNFYSEVFIGVRKHCGRKWNVWMANLRHDYFKTPWSMISFLAAGFLLLLTVIQTLYTVLSYYQ